MAFKAGDRVVYPHHGAAIIEKKETKEVFGEKTEYLVLRMAHGEMTLSVPVDKHTFYTDPAEFDAQLARLELYVQDHPTDRDARLVLAVNLLFGNRPATAVDLYAEGSAPAAALVQDDAVRLTLESAKALQYGTPANEKAAQPGD